MTGAVDFHKDMDFWQQDKWSGSFPVKWHIIKDVPNPNFRHIILENNENKPVTNSRDTQEVWLLLTTLYLLQFYNKILIYIFIRVAICCMCINSMFFTCGDLIYSLDGLCDTVLSCVVAFSYLSIQPPAGFTRKSQENLTKVIHLAHFGTDYNFCSGLELN